MSKRFQTKECRAFSTARYWQDVMQIANCSVNIAKKSTTQTCLDYSQIYCIALLNKIGLLALVNLFPQIMQQLLEDSAKLNTLSRRIRAHFDGLDHYDVGSLLLTHWSLPVEYSACIAQLHDQTPIKKHIEMTSILRLAKQLIDADMESYSHEYTERLRLTQNDIAVITNEINKDKLWIEEFAMHL